MAIMIAEPLRPRPPCQYGVFSVRCGEAATTKRQRSAGRETWDVCDKHAAFLDRLRVNVTKHKPLLDRLKEG